MLKHMPLIRTTIRLPEDLIRAVKRLAAETNRTMTRVIEESLRETLTRRDAPPERGPVQLPTFAGGGLRPGVDLDDSAALLELMEGGDDPA
jgi:hypothetical protein